MVPALRGRKYNRFQPYNIDDGLRKVINLIATERSEFKFGAGRGRTSKGHEKRTKGARKAVIRTHSTISNDLYKYFAQVKKVSKEGLSEEKTRVGGKLVDFVRKDPDGFVLFEIKTSNQALENIREAIGQLLEYALLDSKAKIKRLVIVGPAQPRVSDSGYFRTLQKIIKMPLEYWAYTFDEVPLKDKFKIYT